jgi:hypothetical protein
MSTVDEVAESAWAAGLHAAFASDKPGFPFASALRAKLESTGALRRLRARLRADVTLALEAEQVRPCCALLFSAGVPSSPASHASLFFSPLTAAAAAV